MAQNNPDKYEWWQSIVAGAFFLFCGIWLYQYFTDAEIQGKSLYLPRIAAVLYMMCGKWILWILVGVPVVAGGLSLISGLASLVKKLIRPRRPEPPKFDDIYNWLARRNIGKLLGLRWDPEKDKKYQRERLIRNAENWLHSVDRAEKELAKGNIQIAGDLAYMSLEKFPEADLPVTKEIHARARSIIARLPSDFKPPAPTPIPVLPRMSARDALANLKEASMLQDAGKLQEAYKLVNAVLDHKIYGADALEAELTAIDMRVTLNEKL